MTAKTPISEATQTATTAITDLMRKLFLVKPLAMVYPETKTSSVHYRTGESVGKYLFPFSLPCIIYAVFHRNDDPEFFDAVNAMVAGKSRYSYDPLTKRLKPNVTLSEGADILDRLKEALKFRMDTKLDSMKTLEEGSDIVAGYLTSPHILTDDVGRNFEATLLNIIYYAAPGDVGDAMIDRLGKVKKNAVAEYINDLAIKRLDPDGRVLPRPKYGNEVGMDEISVYIACRMAEHFADDVLESAEDIDSAKKLISILTYADDTPDAATERDLESAIGKVNAKRLYSDALQYATEWITDEGKVKGKRERLTGSGATEYVPLDVENRNDLIRAYVAPKYVINMFACDCRKFIPADGWKTDKAVSSESINRAGIGLIAKALELPANSTADDINTYIRTELVPDTQTAKEVRANAIEFVKKYLMSDDEVTHQLAANILRHVFQVKDDDDIYTRTPGIGGEGDEIRYRKTGVALNNIKSKIISKFPPSSGKYMVVADNRPTSGDLSDEHDTFTVDIDGIEKEVSRSDRETLDTYERPELVKFEDNDKSYPVYAIWEGIVPYSKVVDNKPTYDISQSPETVAAREGSAEDLIKGAMQSVTARSPMGALGVKSIPSGHPLTHDELMEIGNGIKTLDETKYSGILPGGTEGSNDEVLRDYMLLTAIKYYNGKLNDYNSKAGNGTDDTYARKDAVMSVMGNPDVMISASPDYDNLIERISDAAEDYTSARAVSGDQGELAVGDTVRAYLDDYFNFVEDEDVPVLLKDNYGSDKRSILRDLRLYVGDLLNTAIKVVSGYGYRGIRLTNSYSGGRYSFNNRLTVRDAAFNYPIGNFKETEYTKSVRDNIIDNVLKPVASALDWMLSQPGRAVDALNRIAENGKSKDIIDASVMDSSVKSVIDAVGEEGKGLALAYGILRGTIVGEQMFTSFVQMLSNGSAKRGISAIRPQVTTKELSTSIANLNKELSNPATDLGKAAQLLMYIQRLSDGGEDFRPIRELLGNEPGNVGKTTRLIYGKLMGAIDSCRRTAERVGGLEKDLLKTGSIDMGLRQNVGEDVDLTTVEGEDALADVAAAEDNGSDVNETVESGLEDWDGTKSYGTYLGLSGYAGIDTIKAGESGGYDMASSLADRESVGEGLSPYYVGICSRMIDDAVNSHEKLLANGPKAEFAMTSRNIKAWADKVISIASSYMLSRNKLDITGVTEDRKHKIDPDDALEWKKMTSVVLREIEQMCTDAVPDDAMVVADEIVKMIKDLDISRATLESISQVSTALAHMILKLGEISNSAQESDPLAGVSDSAAIPTGVLDMAKVRAMQGKSTRGIKQGAKEGDEPDFLTTVKNQMDGDSDLAKLISNLYETYGRDATEGYANALGAMDAAAHAAENKTYRAKTELRGGVAPTQFAAMLYGLVWDAEQAGDAKYTNILKTINALSDAKPVAVPVPANERNKTAETKNVRFTINGDEATPEHKAEAPVLVVDVITMADLDERVNIGDNAGRTYAECAFGSPDEIAMPIDQAIEQDPALGKKLAAALRVQMVDRLLSDSTFSSMRENDELWDKFSDRVTKQALDLNGTSSAMLFVTLDHAILNLGREVRQKELQQKIKDDTALGEEFASEQMVTKNTEGGSDTITVGEEPLTAAIRQCLFGQSEERRKDGKKALSDLVGIHLADEFLSSLDKAEITKRFKSGEKAIDIAHEYAVSLIEKYGKTPEQMASEGKESDRKFRRAVATIKMGLYAIATGKPDANGISPDKYKDTRLPDIMGKRMSDALVNELMTRLDKYPNADDRTVGRIVDRLVDQVLHSSSNVVHALMKYAGINTDTRSNVSRWSAMRETGGLTSSGSYKAEKSETKRRAKLIVEEELNKLDPESSDSERKRLYRILNQVGFIGSIDDFCNQVKEGVPQDALAHKFASDDQNYQSAFRSMISGKYSAVTPSDSVASDELVLDVARGMERLGRHGMTMVHDADGEEEPFVMFSNSQTPRSLRAGYAARQLELLMDEYKRKYGESFTDENGETTDAKIKKLDDMMQHAATPYPVNPVATTKELVPLVVGILNNDIVPGGRHWATVMGGAHGHHTYKLEIERGENHFIALVAERLVETTIKSIARESGDDITLSKIMQELMRLRRYNKAEVLKSGILTKLADTVKKRISSRIESRINTMVKNGVAETSENGIYVIWENAPAPKPDGGPEPTSGKSAASAPGGKPATGMKTKRAAIKKRAASPEQVPNQTAQPEDNGASESDPKTT